MQFINAAKLRAVFWPHWLCSWRRDSLIASGSLSSAELMHYSCRQEDQNSQFWQVVNSSFLCVGSLLWWQFKIWPCSSHAYRLACHYSVGGNGIWGSSCSSWYQTRGGGKQAQTFKQNLGSSDPFNVYTFKNTTIIKFYKLFWHARYFRTILFFLLSLKPSLSLTAQLQQMFHAAT